MGKTRQCAKKLKEACSSLLGVQACSTMFMFNYKHIDTVTCKMHGLLGIRELQALAICCCTIAGIMWAQ